MSKVEMTITENGTIRFFKNGCLHSICDLPAEIMPDGLKLWYKNGRLNRRGGPAIEYPDGSKLWYRRGKFIKEQLSKGGKG